MISALVISNIISWVVVIAMAVVVFALARQIGVLHERIKPVGDCRAGWDDVETRLVAFQRNENAR